MSSSHNMSYTISDYDIIHETHPKIYKLVLKQGYESEVPRENL